MTLAAVSAFGCPGAATPRAVAPPGSDLASPDSTCAPGTDAPPRDGSWPTTSLPGPCSAVRYEGGATTQWAYVYDGQRLVRETVTRGQESVAFEYRYDDLGRMRTRSGGGEQTTYRYDDCGRVLERRGPSSRTEFQYGTNGRLAQERRFSGGRLAATRTYAHAQGRLRRVVETRVGAAAIEWEHVWRDGRLAHVVTRTRARTVNRTVFSYDAAGRTTRRKSTAASGRPASTVTDFAYDKRGNLVLRRDDDGGGTVTTTYDYACW